MIYLQEMSLRNFRCYGRVDFEFSPLVNIIVGANAVGKTSVVEAIHCLGFLKSHKASLDEEMIKWNEDFALIKGRFQRDSKVDDISLALTRRGKRIQSNGKTHKQLSEYLGYLNSIIFCPEDINIIKGSPSIRRRFLDSNLVLFNPNYLRSLSKYRHLLKQRNEMLKNINKNGKYDQKYFKIVTESLAEEAEIIIRIRLEFIKNLSPLLASKSQAISNFQDYAVLKYLPSTEEELLTALNKNIRNDIQAKTTTIGPHRDDFEILLNNVNSAAFGSQGQQRTIALALKLAFAEYLNLQKKDIIIILDDVFSELDNERQNEIMKIINSGTQTFITTTTIDNLSDDILNRSKIITIGKEVQEYERTTTI